MHSKVGTKITINFQIYYACIVNFASFFNTLAGLIGRYFPIFVGI